jgi:ribosome-associated protein
VSEPPEPPDEPEQQESARSVRKRARREAGVDSAELAHELMKLPASALPKLGLDEDLREALARARAVTSMIARRRAERSLAGALRRVDLPSLAARIANVRATGMSEPRRLHAAERWRERLLDDEAGVAAFFAAFPTADHSGLSQQLADARRERKTGKPPGAARALFRRIIAVLEAADAAKAEEADAKEKDEDSDER